MNFGLVIYQSKNTRGEISFGDFDGNRNAAAWKQLKTKERERDKRIGRGSQRQKRRKLFFAGKVGETKPSAEYLFLVLDSSSFFISIIRQIERDKKISVRRAIYIGNSIFWLLIALSTLCLSRKIRPQGLFTKKRRKPKKCRGFLRGPDHHTHCTNRPPYKQQIKVSRGRRKPIPPHTCLFYIR